MGSLVVLVHRVMVKFSMLNVVRAILDLEPRDSCSFIFVVIESSRV